MDDTRFLLYISFQKNDLTLYDLIVKDEDNEDEIVCIFTKNFIYE
jgi:hypothetical protein